MTVYTSILNNRKYEMDFPTNGHVSPKQVTLQQTFEVMQSLIVPGKQANGKVAFWNAALSIRNKLDRNGVQAGVMRGYANKPLPEDRNVLNGQLGGVMARTIKTLYEIERLWNTGDIHFNCGNTFESQFAWRNEMCALIFGMSMKTVSWALNIYSPHTCQLITIDCWHCKRIGFNPDELTVKRYIQLERSILDDCLDLADTDDRYYPVSTLAACLWERTRQVHGKSEAQEGTYQEHNVSCYV